MTLHSGRPTARAFAAWSALGACLAIATVTWFGYRATREWQRSTALLVERRADEAADLLAMALQRDMRGAGASLLMRLHWDQIQLEPPYEVGDLVASAFARYPYPELFFGWHAAGNPGPVVFLLRADQPPHWLLPRRSFERFPVGVVTDPPAGMALRTRVARDVEQGRPFSAFETELAGQPYQVFARLFYRTDHREGLERVFGFIVNLSWVRRAYFSEITRQVARMGRATDGLAIAVVDDEGRPLVSSNTPGTGPPKARPFPLLFFDPLVIALDPPPDLPQREWRVEVSTTADSAVMAAVQGSDRTLLLMALAAVALAVSLVATARAVRIRAELVEMRSDFVASVTHEIKTPLATIRAVGDTLVRGRFSQAADVRDYAQLLVQEGLRLTRLVDNLLAYSRVTDAKGVYSFEPLAVAELVDDAIRGFQLQVTERGFKVAVEIPTDLPAVRGDRTALALVLDNILDNAIRYSGDGRWLGIRAVCRGHFVDLEISDAGVGIPEEELSEVLKKFVRGRQARGPGSGLGLAIARRIVADHGGALVIQSRLGHGTTVVLNVPTAEV